MIDYGLLMSIVVALGAPSALARRWPITGYKQPVTFTEVAVVPAFIGLLIGRLVALALDDPSSMLSLADLLIVRSGVEFWPGVAGAAIALAASATIDKFPVSTRIAAMAPLSMVGYASYEAACVFRDGCYGPESPIGLTPPGIETRMLPIGWFMAAAIIFGALHTRRSGLTDQTRGLVILKSLAWVAGVRAVGSIWLPHVGEGFTRQHLASIAVASISVTTLTIAILLKPWLKTRTNRLSTQAGKSGP